MPKDGKQYILSTVSGYEVKYATESYEKVSELMGYHKPTVHPAEPSSIEISINNKPVEVIKKSSNESKLEDCVRSPIFSNWVSKLGNHIVINSIVIQEVRQVGPQIMSIKISLNLDLGADKSNGDVLLKGNSAVVLPVITNMADGKRYTIVTRNHCHIKGWFTCHELPSGMNDEDAPYLGLLRNIFDEVEVGIEFTEYHPIKMRKGASKCDRKLYLSLDRSDESAKFSLVEFSLTEAQFKALKEHLNPGFFKEFFCYRGKCVYDVIPLDDLATGHCDAKANYAYQLYQQHLQTSKEENKAQSSSSHQKECKNKQNSLYYLNCFMHHVL